MAVHSAVLLDFTTTITRNRRNINMKLDPLLRNMHVGMNYRCLCGLPSAALQAEDSRYAHLPLLATIIALTRILYFKYGYRVLLIGFDGFIWCYFDQTKGDRSRGVAQVGLGTMYM